MNMWRKSSITKTVSSPKFSVENDPRIIAVLVDRPWWTLKLLKRYELMIIYPPAGMPVADIKRVAIELEKIGAISVKIENVY